MHALTPGDLYGLEEYARHRSEFRARVIEHKQHRRLALGAHLTLYFEDRLTIQYQIQEMLRIERIFEPDGIRAELDAYNPLVPDGCNWKATLMIEYPDPEERRRELARLVGVEHVIWVQVGDFPPVYAIADEDMERATAEKTSSVHFLRFELTPDMAAAMHAGAGLAAGVEHAALTVRIDAVPEALRESLVADLA
ncbi:MAG: DUF3501 family protein [Gammaproteobacteria bacterium]|nr:DUF3501 family protein [Gammaproteobacteria bacterium]